MRGARGDLALVALRVDEERLAIQAGIGPLAEDMVGNLMLVRDSVAASVLHTGEPLLVADYPVSGAAPPAVRRQIGCVLVAPLVAGDRTAGALAVGRLVGRPPFVPADLADLTAFVRRTAAAREIEVAHDERRLALLVEERTRIRDDLHDNVIQEIFAAGMALQALAERLPADELRDQLTGQVHALDATTERIRSLISDLPAIPAHAPALPLTRRLGAIVDSFTAALRCLPTVTITGPVEASADGELGGDLEAVLREALSNVARHAGATAVEVRLSAQPGDRLVLDVLDDGRGIGSAGRRSGLANMARRAERHGGTLRWTAPPGGGTHLSWSVPIPSPPA